MTSSMCHVLVTTDQLLEQRGKTHGSFEQNAAISQAIKALFHSYGHYPTENPVQCEALDMIALKLSRILSGQANYADHWLDLAGYSRLAAEACNERR
jgi:hypothetical protein